MRFFLDVFRIIIRGLILKLFAGVAVTSAAKVSWCAVVIVRHRKILLQV